MFLEVPLTIILGLPLVDIRRAFRCTAAGVSAAASGREAKPRQAKRGVDSRLFVRPLTTMSDSELSTPGNVPADSQIEDCIRRVVRNLSKADEVITLRIARTRVETELGLNTGFLKGDDTWNGRSKDIIEAAIEEPLSPELPKKSAPKKTESKKSAPKPKAEVAPRKKRKSDEPLPKTKRQKKAATPDSDEDVSDGSDASRRSDGSAASTSSDPDAREIKAMKKSAKANGAVNPAHKATYPTTVSDANGKPSNGGDEPSKDDESDFSSVLDDPPPKKKRQQKSTSPSATSKSKKPAKPVKAGKELSPDEEEMKRLQGWLLKCGIRKVWSKELAKFDTSKQKIKHLKSLLDDVGFTGRYSNERATQIKEARELTAEIEAAKEFNDKWGQKKEDGDVESEEESVEDAKPRRLRPKGLVDFGDSGDEGSD
ncbi:hypothetical protein LTR02_010060 [Friedmanniomyces endolithicus]|nr:hypothetical protein LTR59_005601 [Friedmanniomyces endolithicus]KAK0815767.1 hypothetical protein LTR75_003718 [Friedmanniomyces endolithicus]KAK0849778.1 hypothetical protein LTR03_004964 [Friedmanniomyces endolithicus]KAK0898624.1 hypothetical protein LTR02_010060 [Friedmanniomyces endolithicus]KAK0919355.1 hypothetical protein LTR57_010738 [Friedmanniomyces endolithicus]